MVSLNTIYNEDCLETLSKIEDNSIDLIITSPPYNKGAYAPSGNGRENSVWKNMDGRRIAYDIYSDKMLPSDYEDWQNKIIKECLRVLKPSGSLFYNHKDILHEGQIVSPKWVYNYSIHQQIIWDRGSTCAKDNHYLYPITEYIYWIIKDFKNMYFDKDKSLFKSNIWRMNFEKNPHPAPFPLIMCQSIVSSNCPENGIVYDPFMGSGTTALATIQNGGGRSYIGSEISPKYVKMAQDRINNETMQLKFDL